MPRKNTNIPDEMVNKWKITPMSSMNNPPKLEECVSTWTLNNNHCTCNNCAKKGKRAALLPDPEIMDEDHVCQNMIPSPRPVRTQSNPPKPIFSEMPAPITTRPRRPSVMRGEAEPMQGVTYLNQLTINNAGPVPNALNLEVLQYLSPRDPLPPVQELFKTADNPRQFPPRVPSPPKPQFTSKLAEPDFNSLTSKFMNFPEDHKTNEVPEIPQVQRQEKAESPPPQRHTI